MQRTVDGDGSGGCSSGFEGGLVLGEVSFGLNDKLLRREETTSPVESRGVGDG